MLYIFMVTFSRFFHPYFSISKHPKEVIRACPSHRVLHRAEEIQGPVPRNAGDQQIQRDEADWEGMEISWVGADWRTGGLARITQ